MEKEVEVNVAIPNVLHVEEFIAARLKELSALSKSIGESNRTTSVFQRLPKHMRRRAMSHSIKRVPRILREAHKRQLVKSGALKKIKKSRKRHRNRPRHLLIEYNRRQKNKTWLETHIWHAKRFRMGIKWNYKIPLQSYEKTFRASYRAAASNCLIQDLSYYCCLELCGPFDAIVFGFDSITNVASGLSIRAKCWVNGYREGFVHLFHRHKYPHAAIGKVNFMWQPCSDESSLRTLWLWCHPSFHDELVEELAQVFDLKLVDDGEVEKVSREVVFQKLCVEKNTLKKKNLPHQKILEYTNKKTQIKIRLLKDTLNRFRLTGASSNAVLVKALRSAVSFRDILIQDTSQKSWWNYEVFEKNRDCLQLLKKYSLPSAFPCNIILGCDIIDPRLFMRNISESASDNGHENSSYCDSISPSMSLSNIWDPHVRDEVSLKKFTTAQINKLRSDLLIPGFDQLLLKTVNTVIPILLIQRPGVFNYENKPNYGCGWDLIMPANWAIPIWLSLIYSGARSGGLRESRTINFESHLAPEIPPDTKAGMEYYSEIGSVEKENYFKKPPKKRSNFIKFGIPAPFNYPWSSLTEIWTKDCVPSPDNSRSFYILRDKTELRLLKEHVNEKNTKQRITYKLPSQYMNSLVPISVSLTGKGTIGPFSHICLPKEIDLKKQLKDKKYEGPSEPMHPDVKKHQRTLLRTAHKTELKRLRRKRVKTQRECIRNIGPSVKVTKRKVSPTAEVVRKYLQQMEDLWVPSANSINLRTYCDREICGFVVVGGFSYAKACIIGQGYVAAVALMQFLELRKKLKCEPVLLTRTCSSLKYRFCKFAIID